MSTLKDGDGAEGCSWEGNYEGIKKHLLGYNSVQYITLSAKLMWRAFIQ